MKFICPVTSRAWSCEPTGAPSPWGMSCGPFLPGHLTPRHPPPPQAESPVLLTPGRRGGLSGWLASARPGSCPGRGRPWAHAEWAFLAEFIFWL